MYIVPWSAKGTFHGATIVHMYTSTHPLPESLFLHVPRTSYYVHMYIVPMYIGTMVPRTLYLVVPRSTSCTYVHVPCTSTNCYKVLVHSTYVHSTRYIVHSTSYLVQGTTYIVHRSSTHTCSSSRATMFVLICTMYLYCSTMYVCCMCVLCTR